MKNYIGFSNDHSGSMHNIASAAQRDFNTNILAIQKAALLNNQDTIVNVVMCGTRINGNTGVKRSIVNSNVQAVKPLTSYITDGNSTPLFDSVGELIDMLKAVPDANNPDVSFLIMVTTDGGENSSRKWNGRTLGAEMQRLQNTDRWTFVFRVPRGGSAHLIHQGIPPGNIQEWDQTIKGVEASTVATTSAFNDYYAGRSQGMKSTSTFYTNLKNVSAAEVKANLVDISAEVSLWRVLPSEANAEIRPFVEKRINGPMLKGAAFYQLNKTEKTVQDNKKILIKEKSTGYVYYGDAARQMIGMPTSGNARLVPGDHGKFDIYIQSTSVNRKLVDGSNVLYWPKVGVAFTEGPSYQPAVKNVPPIAVPPKQALTGNTKINLVRVKDRMLVMEVNSIQEANEQIAKAKRNKKAALTIA
jgi:hypothetical protein